MGVDATLFVVADYGPYIEHTFSLARERDLWEELNEIPVVGTYGSLQLPQGSWCWFAGETRPDEYEDNECGWISDDNYGSTLAKRKGAHFAGVTSTSALNRAILAFIVEHFSGKTVVIFWH
jgi:hypothetical protein